MKGRNNDNEAQLLLVTGVLLATTVLLIGEVATHTITLGVESNLERSHSLALEYLNVREKFMLAFRGNLKLLDKYYIDSNDAIKKAFEKTTKQCGEIEAYHGINFLANINNITLKANRKFEVNFTLKMKDLSTYIEEDIHIIVELFASDKWWENNEKWNFRIPILINTNKIDALVRKNINFTQEINKFGSGIFDENSIRIIEYNDYWKIQAEVPYQFKKEIGYHSSDNAICNIFWFSNGSSIGNRYYYIYFDIIENGLKNKTEYEILLPYPVSTPGIIFEDFPTTYNFEPNIPISITNRMSGSNSFNSNGSCYFENESLGAVGVENHYISFWLYFNNSHADILFGVQINNNSWVRWGFDSDQIFNGSSWDETIIGNTTNVTHGIWNYYNIDLIEDLNISEGRYTNGRSPKFLIYLKFFVRIARIGL